jgi:hypothetical protein
MGLHFFRSRSYLRQKHKLSLFRDSFGYKSTSNSIMCACDANFYLTFIKLTINPCLRQVPPIPKKKRGANGSPPILQSDITDYSMMIIFLVALKVPASNW